MHNHYHDIVTNKNKEITMSNVGKKIKFTWNTEGLPMDQANGHYPNETETVTVLSEDEDTLYCTNAVEINKENNNE